MSNPLVEIMKLGQSIWYDNIRRALLISGDLQKKIDEDDLRGVTSNPTIFEKAITGSTDYDDQLRSLVSSGLSVKDIYEALVIDDIARAADILKPVYHKTDGIDGYISLEVSPRLAYETQGTIEEADRLFKRLGRRNVMIKIPAAQEGLPAIEEAIYRGINVNVTMIFSIENYGQVAEAFIKGPSGAPPRASPWITSRRSPVSLSRAWTRRSTPTSNTRRVMPRPPKRKRDSKAC